MSLPPVTTAQQPNTLITTTAVNLTNSNQTSSPALRTRPTGWHAKLFGFDWNKRSDHHKYLVKSGLPEVHAAIVNDDWDLALELIGPDDFGLVWLPPASQRQPQNGGTDLDASTWTVDLLNKNENIRDDAILRMALHINHVTSQDNSIFYGANLLTLCLSKPARPDVLQYVITLAAKQAPQYLNLPDAMGRTPLWVAIENQNQANMQRLLKAGADPLQACKFSEQGEPKSLLFLAAKYANKEIFRDLLLATLEHLESISPYDKFGVDPFYLKQWISVHSSQDVLWLADQVQALRGPILCCKDKSGSSYFYRSIIDGSLDAKLKNGNEDLIEWLKSLDISIVLSDDTESSPLYAAASKATILTYYKLNDFFSQINSAALSNIKKHEVHKKIEEQFLLSRTSKDFDHYLDHFPKPQHALKSTQKKILMEMQYHALLLYQKEINFNDYARIVKNVWPFISDYEKNKLFLDAALKSDDRMELVFSLLDCSLYLSTIEAMMHYASTTRKKTAFEFAADRSFEMGEVLKSLRAGIDEGNGMFHMALSVGSLKWVEQLIAAGLNRQKTIAESSTYMSMLADLDPQGLSEKLKGLNYKITQLTIDHACTEAGKQALTALINKAKNNS